MRPCVGESYAGYNRTVHVLVDKRANKGESRRHQAIWRSAGLGDTLNRRGSQAARYRRASGRRKSDIVTIADATPSNLERGPRNGRFASKAHTRDGVGKVFVVR